jgi:hypothetical protein
MDERRYREELVKLHRGESFDYLVVGSSRSMSISGRYLEGNTLLNLGMSGAKLEDLAALYQLCKDNDVHYKCVILGADQILLNEGYQDTRWYALAPYYSEFIGRDCGVSQNGNSDNLFSLSYFAEAIKTLWEGAANKHPFEYTERVENEGMTYCMDGSIYYDRTTVDKAQSEVDRSARFESHPSYQKTDFNDYNRTQLFDQVVKAYSSQAKVIFWFSPVHPLFYARWSKMHGLLEASDKVVKYAEENHIPTIGDFNPTALGLKNTDFYDFMHCRSEVVNRIVSSNLKTMQLAE